MKLYLESNLPIHILSLLDVCAMLIPEEREELTST